MGKQIEEGNGKVAFWLILVTLLLAAAFMVRPFLHALLWASVLSVLLYPWYRKTRERLKERRHKETLASLYVTLLTAFLIIVPGLTLMTVGAVEVYNMASNLVKDSGDGQLTIQNLANEADAYLKPWIERVGANDFTLTAYLEEHKADLAQDVTAPALSLLKKIVTMVVTLIVAFLTTFFMLRDGHLLLDPVAELIPLPRDRTVAILSQMAATIRSVFFSVVAVAILQGLVCLILYWALGVPSPMAWWAMTTLFAMIPLLGAPVGFVPAALVLFLTGNVWQGALLLALGFGVVSTMDNFLRPVFISMGSNLHMMAIFFSLLGGVLTLGPIGLMAGPMLLTVILGLLDVLRERRRLSEEAT